MKKVLAIVLAVIMTFSMTVAGFAAMQTGVAEGKFFFGMDDVAYANPGETIDIPLYYCGIPFASDGYPEDGAYVIPFYTWQDINNLAVNGFTLSDEAVAAGIELYDNPDSAYKPTVEEESGYFSAALIMPASGASSEVCVGSLNVTVSSTWVPTYDDENTDLLLNAVIPEIDFLCYFISAEDAALVDSGDMLLDEVGAVVEVPQSSYLYGNRDILPRPYEPTMGEYLTEYMKGIAALLVEAIGIGLNFLAKELETADWYDPSTPPEGLEFLTDISKGLEEILGKLVGELI